MNTYDFLSIGDAVADNFIRITDADVVGEPDTKEYKLCLRFADKVPFESSEVVYGVGNGPNAAVAAARLGYASALSAMVGNDDLGKKCLEALTTNGVATEYVGTDLVAPTNYHYVLWYVPERTILIKHVQYTRTLPANLVPPKWIYLTSLGSNTEPFHQEIIAWLEQNPSTKIAFQPGTFQMKLGTEKLKAVYQRADAFFCNMEEAQRILGVVEKDAKKLMDAIHALGPKIVVVTDGVRGAYAREEDGTSWFMPIYPNTPFERTGAGDAFSSTFTVALSMGKSVQEALLWAPINSMSVTEHVGAQKGLLTVKQIEEYLAKAPTDYKPTQI